MIKRILLVLDASQPGIRTQQYAIEMAQKYGAHITGLAILDTPWITAAQPEPLGGPAFKIHRDDMVIRQSQEHIDFLVDEFKKICEKEKLSYEAIEAEGFPAVEVERLAHEHDVICIGKTTDFHFDLDDDSDITVKHIARDNPRPLILVPSEYAATDKVMVAYDGSLQVARSLHMFLLLGMAKGKEIHIVSGHKIKDKAEVVARRAVAMCEAYGVKAVYHPIELDGSVADALLETLKEINASMLVMGGFSHNILHEAIFGSCTKTLMRTSPVPVFLHH